MKPFRFLLCLLVFTLFLGSSSALAQSQGLMFVDRDEWNTAITGTVLDDDFNSLVNVDGDLVIDTPTLDSQFLTNPQQLAWGQLSAILVPGPPDFQSLTANVNEGEAAVFLRGEKLIFDLDPTLGQFEGFFTKVFNQDIRLSLFDGDTLVETLDEPDFYIAPEDRFPGEFGWVNTTGLNVTRIEVTSLSLFSGTFSFADLDLAFAPVVEPPVVDPDIFIPMLIDDIEGLIESNVIGQGQGNPIKNFLNQALKEINKGKTDKAIDKLIDASERVLALIDDGSLSAEQGQEIIDMIDLLIFDLLEL